MAGTLAVSADNIYVHPATGKRSRVISLALTHAAGALSAELSDSTAGLKHGPITGWWGFCGVCKPGGTAPTDATDLTIKDANGDDLLNGNGADKVDSTTVESFCFGAGSEKTPRLIPGTLTIATANNVVAAATFTMQLTLI